MWASVKSLSHLASHAKMVVDQMALHRSHTWFQGLPLVWDFTCVDTLASSGVHTGTVTTATGAERDKELKGTDLQYVHVQLTVRKM